MRGFVQSIAIVPVLALAACVQQQTGAESPGEMSAVPASAPIDH